LAACDVEARPRTTIPKMLERRMVCGSNGETVEQGYRCRMQWRSAWRQGDRYSARYCVYRASMDLSQWHALTAGVQSSPKA
jgi:hypothetical protein